MDQNWSVRHLRSFAQSWPKILQNLFHDLPINHIIQKSRIRETLNLSTNADHRTNASIQPANKNIARIAKRCPENIASVVKCVKLFLPKVLRKY